MGITWGVNIDGKTRLFNSIDFIQSIVVKSLLHNSLSASPTFSQEQNTYSIAPLYKSDKLLPML